MAAATQTTNRREKNITHNIKHKKNLRVKSPLKSTLFPRKLSDRIKITDVLPPTTTPPTADAVAAATLLVGLLLTALLTVYRRRQ